MTKNSNASSSPVDHKVRALELAREAGFDTDLPAFLNGTAIALKLIELAQRDEREACAKVCEAGINNADDWDSSQWDQACENRAVAIRMRSNADVKGRPTK